MRKMIVLTAVSFVLVFAGSMLHAQQITVTDQGEIIQKTPDGEINWTNGVISAVGYASSDQDAYAQRVAASASARANLLAVLGDVSIKRGITVEKGKLTGDINIQRIEGVLSHSYIGTPKRQQDGTVAVAAYKTLDPPLLKEILPSRYFKGDGESMQYKPTPLAPEPQALPKPSKPYTGMIVDARGLGVIPSLGFRILVEGTGETLYGLSSVDRMKVIKARGMAGYASTVEAAKANSRAGGNPLVVKATEASGKRNTDIYVSKEDAAAIYKANLESSFLKDLKLIIVCGG